MMIRVLRGLAGLAILAVGLFVMNGLIGLKETPAVKPRAAAARAVKRMPVTNGALSPEVAIEGRVQAMNRMTILSEVSGLLPVGGKEFREGVTFGRDEAMVRLNDAEPRATLVAQKCLNFLRDFLFGTLSLSTPLTFCEIRGALLRSSSFCDQR